MRYVDVKQLPKTIRDTRTMLDFGNELGIKPDMQKEVINLSSEKSLSASKLVTMLSATLGKKVQPKVVESFSFQWRINTAYGIHRVKFAEACTFTGEGQAPFEAILEEDHFNKNETIELENKQQLFVLKNPTKLAPGRFKYLFQLVSDTHSRVVNTTYMAKGYTARFLSNYQPELSERGYTRYMSNVEKHINFINRHRVSESISGDLKANEFKFVEHLGEFYKMTKTEKRMIDELNLAANNSFLFAQTNYDKSTFKCLITEEDGRPIPIGEGIIPQFRRFAEYMPFSGNLTIQKMKDAIVAAVGRREEKVGHNLVMLCNYAMYIKAQDTLDQLAEARIQLGDYFLTRADGTKLIAGEQYMLGANYTGYKYGGNSLTLMLDNSLTTYFDIQAFGIIFNTLAETSDGTKVPNVAEVTIQKANLIKGELVGMGGKGGYDSGMMSSPIHGSEVSYMKYSGAQVNDPYSAVILEQV